jgi:hypothetical protein
MWQRPLLCYAGSSQRENRHSSNLSMASRIGLSSLVPVLSGLGSPIPFATQEGLKSANPDKAALAKLLMLVSEAFRNRDFTAKKLAETATSQKVNDQGFGMEGRAHDELFELLRTVAPEKTDREKINAIALGMYLSRNEGSIAEGQCFRSRITHKQAVWHVEKVKSDARP